MRYDIEAKSRKDGFSEKERADLMKLNKVSATRFKEEVDRGFDILTNDPLKGPEASSTVYAPKGTTQQRGVWTRAIQSVNSEFMTAEEKD